MLKCPKCSKELHWFGDNDTWIEDVWVGNYGCKDCQIEVNIYFGDGLEKEEAV